MNTVVPMSSASSPAQPTTQAINPATGEVLGELSNTAADAYPTVFAQAREAQKTWAATSFKERHRHIRKMRDYIRDNADELARIVSEGNGKTRVDAMVTEVLPCVLACNWYGSHAAKVLRPQRREASSLVWAGKRSVIRHEPLGVVGIVSPWNYPLSIPFGEIVMGLMAGNAIVLKVASATPLVGQAIEKIIAAGELPAGLFTHLVGSGGAISTAMFANDVDKLFFTGSVPAGKQLMAQAAETLTPVSLELGGKDAMIVLEDADIDRAASGAAWAGFQNAGQSCGGVERIYVHHAVHDAFVNALQRKVQALRHGIPDAECAVDIGAMTTKKQRQTVERQLKLAKLEGARVIAQSQAVGPTPGEFHPAVLVTGVNHDMTLMREETFGPVLPVMPFSTEDEAVELANDCSMALTASIWTRDIARGKQLASRVDGGVITINNHLYTHGMSDLPWGGPKESGVGRTHGPEGLLEMSRTKVVNWDYMRARREMWWYPQDKATYQAVHSAINLVAPPSLGAFLRAAIQVLPFMLRKMYRRVA